MAEQMKQEAAGKTIPAGYKQTEVGVIPEDWEVAPIGSVLSITTGARNTQDKVDDGRYPFFVRSQTVERINTYSFDGEAVLTAGDGVGTGKIFHYVNGKFDFHQRVYLMYNFGERVSGYFFYLYFSNNFFERIMSMTAKSSVDSVRREMIADMKMVLPSKVEQTAIANVLSDSDALIDALEQLIAKKQAIKSATMQQLLTGRTRLPAFALRLDGTKKGYKPSELGDIPEDWEVVPFGNTLAIRHGKNQKAVENPNGTIPILATGGQIGWADQYLWNKPSVLIGRKGTIDKPRYSDKPFWTVDTLFYSEIKDCVVPKFIFYKFCMIDWMQYNEASGVPSLNASTIERVLASLPLKEEQTAIATILSDMDNELQTLTQKLEKARALKQGMMQQLLTGKIRLPLAAGAQTGA